MNLSKVFEAKERGLRRAPKAEAAGRQKNVSQITEFI
jgi:hypothetical protein